MSFHCCRGNWLPRQCYKDFGSFEGLSYQEVFVSEAYCMGKRVCIVHPVLVQMMLCL